MSDNPMSQGDQQNARLRLAVQKSGRLSQNSYDLLKRSGLDFNHGKRILLSSCKSFPLDVMMVRDDDIPEFVKSNTSQLAIIGENVLYEKIGFPSESKSYQVLHKLGFGHCRLSIAVPKGSESISVLDEAPEKALAGKRIATTYPKLLQKYLAELQIDAHIVSIEGAVEIAPALDVADAICDLVSTGSTLRANGLVEYKTILESQSVLVQSTAISEEQKSIVTRLLARIEGSQKADRSKYVMLNAPADRVEEIAKLIPGLDKPTVLPLHNDPEWLAIHAVTSEDVFWNTLENLKAAGARSILVLPIEKIID